MMQTEGGELDGVLLVSHGEADLVLLGELDDGLDLGVTTACGMRRSLPKRRA